MTHSIDAPLPPPATAGTGAPPTTTTDAPTTGATETKDVAARRGQERRPDRRRGRQPGRLDRDRPGQGGRPGDPAPGQGPARPGPHAAQEQAVTQQQKAAEGLTWPRAAAARHRRRQQPRAPPARPRDLLQQASGIIESFAGKLQNREPAELLDEVRSFARRKPGPVPARRGRGRHRSPVG